MQIRVTVVTNHLCSTYIFNHELSWQQSISFQKEFLTKNQNFHKQSLQILHVA